MHQNSRSSSGSLIVLRRHAAQQEEAPPVDDLVDDTGEDRAERRQVHVGRGDRGGDEPRGAPPRPRPRAVRRRAAASISMHQPSSVISLPEPVGRATDGARD